MELLLIRAEIMNKMLSSDEDSRMLRKNVENMN